MSERVVVDGPWPASTGQSGGGDEGSGAPRQVAASGGGPQDPGMLARIVNLEATISDIRVTIGRIDERTGLLATKEDVANVRTDLATKATRGTVWGMGFTVAGLFVAALAAGAIYMPYLATLLRRAGQ